MILTGSSGNYRNSVCGYLPIENYGLIGNLRTAALIGIDGSCDFLCLPYFSSPSVFCRLLDKEKGGYFSITPLHETTSKQQYLPSTCILATKFLSEEGVSQITDFFPRPAKCGETLFPWMVRRAECIRGDVTLKVEIFPAFDYARAKHDLTMSNGKILFWSEDAQTGLELSYLAEDNEEECNPEVNFEVVSQKGLLSAGAIAHITLTEGQAVTFSIRQLHTPSSQPEAHLSEKLVQKLQADTQTYWGAWIMKSNYRGRWQEFIIRSALTLKLLTFELTGAVIASPTFSLPESVSGARNWDYRYTWIRDSAFTVYAFLRLGFIEEADAYMKWIEGRMEHRNPVGDERGPINIMYTVWGTSDIEEHELSHLEGYKSSAPVRIGNGASEHLQLDIYGELMDAIYLYHRLGRPISYSMWCHVRVLCDWVVDNWGRGDMSIWEVRSQKMQFTYSKVMLWVALDRGLRLADKRSFPCPHRHIWLKTRDTIYEVIMTKGWNEKMNCFIQAFEEPEILDSAVLIMPLVFFISPNDPRFVSTIKQILKPPEKGGLTSNGLVFRYNHLRAHDGVGGGEGSFSMCTFWLVEAMTRAGQYDREMLAAAVRMFEDMLGYANHLFLYSEEIARSGESLGNFPQAFTHIACISTAFNLDRVLSGIRRAD